MEFRAWMLFIAVGTEYLLNCIGSPIKTEAILIDNETSKQKSQVDFLLSFDDKTSPTTHKLEIQMVNNADQHLRNKRTVGKCLAKISQAIERKIQKLKGLQKALHQIPSVKVNNFKNINLNDNGRQFLVNINDDKNLLKSGREHNDDIVEMFNQLADKSRTITNLLRQQFYRNLTNSIFNNTKEDILTKPITKEEISAINHNDNITKSHSGNKSKKNLRNEVSNNREQPYEVNINEDKNLMKSGKEYNHDLIESSQQLADKARQTINLRRQEFYRKPASSVYNHTKGDITTESFWNEEESNRIDNKDQHQFDNVEKKDPRQFQNTEKKAQRDFYNAEKNLRDEVSDSKEHISKVSMNENKKLMKIAEKHNDNINVRTDVSDSIEQPYEVIFKENKKFMKNGQEHSDDLTEKFKQTEKARTNLNLQREEFYRNLTSSIFNNTREDVIHKTLTKDENSATNDNDIITKNPKDNIGNNDQHQFDNGHVTEWSYTEPINEYRNGQEVRRKTKLEDDKLGIGNRKVSHSNAKKIAIKESAVTYANKGIKMKCICEAINDTRNESPRYKRNSQQFEANRNY